MCRLLASSKEKLDKIVDFLAEYSCGSETISYGEFRTLFMRELKLSVRACRDWLDFCVANKLLKPLRDWDRKSCRSDVEYEITLGARLARGSCDSSFSGNDVSEPPRERLHRAYLSSS